MSQSVVQPFSPPVENASYGYSQQSPPNHMHTAPVPGVPQSQTTAGDDLASSMASMTITNEVPSAQPPMNTVPPTTTSGQPVAAAYTYSSDVSTAGRVPGYRKTAENPQAPHLAHFPKVYAPLGAPGVGTALYPPANPTTREENNPNHTSISSTLPLGYASLSQPATQHVPNSNPSAVPSYPSEPHSSISPVTTQQPTSAVYAQGMAAYPGAPPPVGPAGVGSMYNPTPAASVPVNAHGPAQPYTHAQSGPLPTPGPYPLNYPNLNADSKVPVPPPQLYGQAPPMPLPNGHPPANDANRGAAADYYDNSIPSQAPHPAHTPFRPGTYANPGVSPNPGIYPAQPLGPHDPHNPTHPHAVAAPYNQVHGPQSLDPAAAPGEFDETDEDDVPADGERGLGFMRLGRKRKRKGHHTGYGYGYNAQYADPYGWYGGAGGYAYPNYDLSAFGGLANFDHTQTIQQTITDNIALNAQMIANSGSSISNLC